MNNFTDSVAAAASLDARLASAAGALSSDYSDLFSISTRQAFGAFDLTIPQPNAKNEVDLTDVKAFARDFGDLGSGGYESTFYVFTVT